MSGSGRDPTLAGWSEGEAADRYLIVDVFTSVALAGNQLAVFYEADALPAERMQRLARELNFSETVFLLEAQGEGDARARIFTPARELPFAGHPVLGSAFVLAARLGTDRVRLETGLGVIPVELEREGDEPVFGRMRQPVPAWREYERAGGLLSALGVAGSGLPVEAYENGPLHVYVELPSEEAVATLRPDLTALAELGQICASCFAGSGRRFRTRVFAPSFGVPEDPATGSAAGPLAIHLARHGRVAFGEQIEIRQGSEMGRPSLLYARVEGSSERIDRVEVGGCAVIVARGEFRREWPGA